jgi:hypothetical protein
MVCVYSTNRLRMTMSSRTSVTQDMKRA